MKTIIAGKLKKILRKLSIVDINVPHVKKVGKNTCWAGCYRMIQLHHNAHPAYFKSLLALQNPSCTNYFCNINPCQGCDKTRSPSNILNDLIKLGYKNTNQVKKYLNTDDIRNNLKKGWPIMTYHFIDNDNAHVVLISGIGFARYFSNCFVKINDPDVNQYELEDIVQFTKDRGDWRDTWVVRK